MTSLATPATGKTPEWYEERDVPYEVVDGELRELMPMGAYPVWLEAIFQDNLGPFVREHQPGRVVPEMLFRIDRLRDLQRRPDIAFVSSERWPQVRQVPRKSPWEVVPELTIEVVSENDKAYEVMKKIGEYFRAGVRRVWVVYPDESLVYDYESPTSVRILERGHDLDGFSILPGFRLPLATLFENELLTPEP